MAFRKLPEFVERKSHDADSQEPAPHATRLSWEGLLCPGVM